MADLSGHSVEVQIEWKWADAGLLPVLGGYLATQNPMRWSQGVPAEVSQQLRAAKTDRPVNLRILGQSYMQEFSTAMEAAQWVEDCLQDEVVTPATGSLVFSLATFAAGRLAGPALAIFCSTNASHLPFFKRNLLAARVYSHRVVSLPFDIATLQRKKQLGVHPRRSVKWSVFDESPARGLADFVAAATLSEEERPSSLQVSGKSYARKDGDAPSQFWAVYQHEADYVIAFRGGDGGKEDAKLHPGSPARAFIAGEDPAVVPALPLDSLRVLGSTGKVTIVGYSQGGIPALGCVLALGNVAWLQECVLLNCATIFWPHWYQELLPSDWWSNPPDFSPKIISWVIRNDPLSDEVPGGSQRMPQVPGETRVVPSCAFGKDIMDNHSFHHFVAEARVACGDSFNEVGDGDDVFLECDG